MELLYNPDDVMREVGGNQIWMETICLSTHNSMEDALEALLNYALYIGEQDRYPVKRQPAFYGFHRWLLNQRKFERNKPGGNTGGLVI